MKACLSQKASIPSIPTQKQYSPVYIQPVPTNHTISNLPQQYYNTNISTLHPQQIPMNFQQQTQFMNRNVR